MKIEKEWPLITVKEADFAEPAITILGWFIAGSVFFHLFTLSYLTCQMNSPHWKPLEHVSHYQLVYKQTISTKNASNASVQCIGNLISQAHCEEPFCVKFSKFHCNIITNLISDIHIQRVCINITWLIHSPAPPTLQRYIPAYCPLNNNVSIGLLQHRLVNHAASNTSLQAWSSDQHLWLLFSSTCPQAASCWNDASSRPKLCE